MRVNKLVNKLVKENNDQEEADEENESMDVSSLCKMHKKNIKYAEKNI